MLRYFVRIDDTPGSPDYGMVQAVMRFDEETAFPERWDKPEGEWVFHPEVLDAFGLGGANDHFEVTPEFAMKAIEAWKVGEKAPSVFTGETGIAKRSAPTHGAMRVVVTRWD